MTRKEHLAWAKQRALEYCDRGELRDAVVSILSDLGKHPELKKSQELGGVLAISLMGRSDKESVRKFIEGFN